VDTHKPRLTSFEMTSGTPDSRHMLLMCQSPGDITRSQQPRGWTYRLGISPSG